MGIESHYYMTFHLQVVTMLSTAHSTNGSDDVGRKVKRGGDWQQCEIRRPDVIKQYNTCMGGVDRSDQMIFFRKFTGTCYLCDSYPLIFMCRHSSCNFVFMVYNQTEELFIVKCNIGRPHCVSSID